MNEVRRRSIGFVVAAIAIAAVLLLLLAPQAHAGHPIVWLVVLPAFFIGLIAPLNVFWRVSDFDVERAPESAFRLSCFQRPPPFRIV